MNVFGSVMIAWLMNIEKIITLNVMLVASGLIKMKKVANPMMAMTFAIVVLMIIA